MKISVEDFDAVPDLRILVQEVDDLVEGGGGGGLVLLGPLPLDEVVLARAPV